MATVYPLGSYLWVPNEADCFLVGRVQVSFKAGEVGQVLVDGEDVSLSPSETKNLIRMDEESLTSLENMVKLKNLNEASILHNLRMRFSQDKIYTSVGNILVSVNPFKLLPIYTPEILDKYRVEGSRNSPPHVYAIADVAYKSMLANNQSQSCIVSGESGAGKTEATKLFLQYIAEVSGGFKSGRKSGQPKSNSITTGHSSSKPEESTLQEQILKANPLMEAFGNAKTVRNDNSSRFGKWIQVRFDGKGSIIEGAITNYLLEKSRIVKQAKGERNYHVFYQLCAGARMESTMKKRFKLRDPDEYHYLSQSGTINVDSINDERDWEDMNTAMSVLKMTPEEREDVLRTLAGILHLGNIQFEADTEGKSGQESSKIINDEMLQLSAEQLGVGVDAMKRALTSRNIGTRSVIYVSYDQAKASEIRDALAKTLYGHLFDWLIRRINVSLANKDQHIIAEDSTTIGVLDIFGFESFETNSFEQLCINYCNEKLQFHFNEQIFKLEQQEYQMEQVDFSNIEFVDNRPCLSLIEEKGTGLLAMIDEEIQVPKGSDTGFLNKVLSRHQTHINFKRTNPKQNNSRDCFTVVHYAGPVDYNVTGFLEKNKDELHTDLQSVMGASQIGFVCCLFQEEAKNREKRASQRGVIRKKTLGTQFKEQLNSLMKTLNETNPHFIRCVKPNSVMEGDVFDSPMVLSQLRYAGLLEVCRIRQVGFPVRRDFRDFVRRFVPILDKTCSVIPLATAALSATTKNKTTSGTDEEPEQEDGPSIPKSVVESVCDALVDSKLIVRGEFCVGRSKLFFRNSAWDQLEGSREQSLASDVTIIQRVARGFISRLRFRSYHIVLSDLKQAVRSRNPDELRSAIAATGELPSSGAYVPLVIQANELLQVVEVEQNVRELLSQATTARDYKTLASAVAAAKEINYSGAELEAAQTALGRLQDELKARHELSRATAARDLGLLKAAILAADSLGVEGVEEYRQASVLKTRLENEAETGAVLEDAVTKRDLTRIIQLMEKMTSLGLDDAPELMQRAQTVRDELQEADSISKALKAGMQQRSVDMLSRALERASQHTLVDDIVGLDQAKTIMSELEQQSDTEIMIRAALRGNNPTEVAQAIQDAEKLGLSFPLLEEAKRQHEHLVAVEECKRQLDLALESTELEALSNAVARAADLGLTGIPLFNSAQNSLKKLGTKAAMSSQISEAIADGDVEVLQELLIKAEAAQGMEKDVRNAKLALARFQDEKVAVSNLYDATKSCVVEHLVAALDKINQFSSLLPKIQPEIGLAKATLEQCNIIETCICNGSISELEAALDKAQSIGAPRNGVVEAGHQMLKKLRIAADLVERLKPLIAAKDKEALAKLLELVPNDMPSNDVVREAQIMVNRERLIAETSSLIAKATATRDLDILNDALQKVFELGLVSPEVEDAKKLHIVLTTQRENCAEVVAQLRTLRTKAKSRLGISPADVEALTKALDDALAKGLSMEMKELQDALVVKEEMVHQLKIQDELREALVKGKFKQLKRAMERAHELPIELELATKVKALVRKRDAERRAAQRAAFEAGEEITFDEDKEDDEIMKRGEDDGDDDEGDDEVVKRERDEKIAKAKHARFHFQKFHKLRSPEDFAKGVFFNKKRTAEGMLEFQSSAIPRSLLELDRDLSKQATRLHKSLLGYCGDKSMSFPETLAQDILTKALETPELVDEVFLQICKHLTNNPGPESIGRCWQLMCMAVGTFPPSSDFEMYLLNFVARQCDVPGLIGNYARYALRRVEGILNSGASGFVPSVEEIQAYKERPPILASISLVDGTALTEDLPVTPDLDVGSVLEICLHFLDITDERKDTFGIFVKDKSDKAPVPGPGVASQMAAKLPLTIRPLRSQDFLGDVVVRSTRQKRNTEFIFRRKIYLRQVEEERMAAGVPVDEDDEDVDPMFRKLEFMQALNDIASGEIHIPDESILLQLTVMAITIEMEEIPDSMEKLSNVDLSLYLPQVSLEAKSVEDWKKEIVECSGQTAVDTPLEMQQRYVDLCATQDPMFGACTFHVSRVNEVPGAPDLARDLLTAFNSDGMHFLEEETKEVLLSFGYADMYRWGGSSSQFSVIIWNPDTQDTFELSLYTTQASDMAGLILDYINAIMASAE